MIPNTIQFSTGCFCVSAILMTLVADSSAAESRPPNIVVFLTDDQGYGDLGCFGSDSLETPNIDRLASEGMKFTDFYVHQRCSPTRLAFMTGCHAHRIGCTKVIYRRDRIGLHDDELTVPELFRRGGYATGMIGKWHLGEWDAFNPIRHGFDFFYGFMVDQDNRTGLYQNQQRLADAGKKTDGAHTPKLLDAAIDFIEEHSQEPFFLYYASPLPHTPWIPNKRFRNTSSRGKYGDVIREIDWQVGKLMDALSEQNVTTNTLFVFASDNGPVLGIDGGDAGPLRDGKWTDFEGGIRVPCLMRWPAVIKPGSTNDQITGIIDMLPTFCAMADVALPSDRVIDGRNIMPYMKSETLPKPIHESFVVPGSVIRHGPWKLLVKDLKPGGKSGREGQRPPAPAGSLFNLRSDPGETNDLSAAHPNVVTDLTNRMDKVVRELEVNQRPIGRLPPSTEAPVTKK